jgi:hypothetical protein
MRPARNLGDRAGLGAAGVIERLEPGIAIGLKKPVKPAMCAAGCSPVRSGL